MTISKNTTTQFLHGDDHAPHEIIGDRVHKFRVELVNRDGKRALFTMNAVKDLVLYDNLLDWSMSGSLIYKNPYDFLERNTEFRQGVNNISLDTWRFRSDGRDYIYIYIDIPITADSKTVSPGVNNEYYTIKFMGCIYDVEDILTSGDNISKYKKLYFCDYRYYRFNERNTASLPGGWSTSIASARSDTGQISKTPLTQKSNRSRSLLTGNALRDLIKNSNQELNGDELPVEFDDKFDKGSTEVFHSVGGGERITDTIKIILDQHVSSTDTGQMPCILRVDRYTDVWSLTPVTELLKSGYNKKDNTPGDGAGDVYKITGESKPGQLNQLQRFPVSEFKHLYNPDTNNILGYEYTDMSPVDQPETVVINTFETSTGKFYTDLSVSDVKSTRDHINNNTISDLYCDQKSGGISNVVLNKTKTENMCVTSKSVNYGSRQDAITFGRNENLKKMIYLGNSISFSVKGMVNRQAGKVISITRDTSYDESDFDDKILGQYLVTEVQHIITPAGYINKIIAVKPYYFRDLQYNEEVE